MKKILILLAFQSVISVAAFSNGADSLQVSLLTCSPGKEVYSLFGHSCLRVYDPKNNVDEVYNYGLFDFNTPNFLFKFISGHTDYQLGVFPTELMLESYRQENRSVVEQVLNLTATEKNKILERLHINYLPQNRVYRYNFVYDNCATRPYIKIMESVNGIIKLDPDAESKSFRFWINEYTQNTPWTEFGIDLIFGMDADLPATQNESLFLPDILMGEVQTATVVSKENTSRKLVIARHQLVVCTETEPDSFFKYLHPLYVTSFILFLGVLLAFYESKYRKLRKSFDSSLFMISGLFGLVLLNMSLFSVHPLVKNNLNLLWLNPFNVVLSIVIWSKKLKRPVFYIHAVNAVLLLGALIVMALSIQVYNLAAFPLIVLLLFRTIKALDRGRRRLFKKKSFSKRRW